MEEIYSTVDRVEQLTKATQYALDTVKSTIKELNARINFLELPFESFYNHKIVVWCSIPSTSSSDSSVCTLKKSMQEGGLEVRSCSSVEETLSTTRALLESGQLLCVIVGGDENSAGNRHFRSLLRELNVDKSAKCALPKSSLPFERFGFYCAHCSLGDDDREDLWNSQCLRFETSRQLLEWVYSLKAMGSTMQLEHISQLELDERNLLVYNRIRKYAKDDTASVMPYFAQLDNAAILALLVDEDKLSESVRAEVTRLQEDVSHTSRASMFADKIVVAKLKVNLEALHDSKTKIKESDEMQREVLFKQMAAVYKQLETLVNGRIQALAESIRPGRDIQETVREFDFVGSDCGLVASASLAWLDAHPPDGSATSTSLNNRQEHILNVEKEIYSLRRLLLSAKVMAHVTQPIHIKLLNLCRNWLTTYLPYCLIKVRL